MGDVTERPADQSGNAAHDGNPRPQRLLRWEEWAIAFIVVAAVANGLARLAVLAAPL